MKARDDDIINFYELESVKKFSPQYHNPCYNKESFPLKHPFRMMILGSSGAGKTNIALNVILKSANTFNHIYVYTANKKEPLYEMLEDNLDSECLTITEGLDSFNSRPGDNLGEGQVLVLFDDMVLDPNQSRIEELFIRGRKLNNKQGISVIYLSQSYFNIPGIIRKQATQLVIKKLATTRDRNAILRDSGGSLDKKDLEALYKYCIGKSMTSFLFIDLNEDEDNRYRRNFNQVLSIE